MPEAADIPLEVHPDGRLGPPFPLPEECDTPACRDARQELGRIRKKITDLCTQQSDARQKEKDADDEMVFAASLVPILMIAALALAFIPFVGIWLAGLALAAAFEAGRRANKARQRRDRYRRLIQDLYRMIDDEQAKWVRAIIRFHRECAEPCRVGIDEDMPSCPSYV